MDQLAIIQTYIDAYNAFDVSTMTSVFTEDMVFEHKAGGATVMTLEGLEAFRRQATAATQYFRDRKQTVTACTIKGEIAEVELDYHAIAAMDLPNGIRAGDEIRLKGKSIFEFSGNQLVRLTDIS